MNSILTHWKSTVIGLCGLGISALQGVQFDPTGHLAMTAKDWVMVAVGVLMAAVGMLMKDAGTTKAILPGQAEPVAVPSHEVPDNPSASPVTGENQ